MNLLRSLVATLMILAGAALLVLGGSGALDGISIPIRRGAVSETPASATAIATESLSPSASVTVAAHNRADVAFLQNMIDRQAQTARLTAVAGEGTLDREAAALVAAISSTEDDERAEMTGWLLAWDEPVTTDTDTASDPDPDPDPDADHGGVEPLSDADLAAVLAADPARFQSAYLHLLVAQQSNAAQIARYALENGENEQVLDLAGRIETSRRAQVQLITSLLRS